MTIPTDGLWQRGYSRLGKLLKSEDAEKIRSLYASPEIFRSHIDMARYRFGRGEYQYFAYPLPERIDQIRHDLYRQLAPVAREWMSALSRDTEYPDDLDAFLESCHTAGQTRPTPLLLRYRESDFNCLHQDLYGDVVFPFQVVIGLSRPGDEYSGGELLLVEQQPRAQSVGHAIRLEQGEAVVITTRYRPVKGSRGYYRTNMRHGVSPLTSGERYTLGIIFHDAK
ncbi:MAG TPA: 2OG-Fe(II) oxygenase [Bryobacteraceae bacterium]|jgi:hypothetical protein|nr:2OG-Fe(II) oxygenase [Bryobacteraceae bacterium]